MNISDIEIRTKMRNLQQQYDTLVDQYDNIRVASILKTMAIGQIHHDRNPNQPMTVNMNDLNRQIDEASTSLAGIITAIDPLVKEQKAILKECVHCEYIKTKSERDIFDLVYQFGKQFFLDLATNLLSKMNEYEQNLLNVEKILAELKAPRDMMDLDIDKLKASYKKLLRLLDVSSKNSLLVGMMKMALAVGNRGLFNQMYRMYLRVSALNYVVTPLSIDYAVPAASQLEDDFQEQRGRYRFALDTKGVEAADKTKRDYLLSLEAQGREVHTNEWHFLQNYEHTKAFELFEGYAVLYSYFKKYKL
eukprot:CAMPEP_0117418248 /NCGR_PEP_ID=MMETSP0758-20121206/72_1 /TAXON_ID=63605 /ORGANISM="Percolomonas cosmopolitus, Strain AE-1 (ATCC 50343)" /LENGTH=304 /DNA_ID=CAMNT_0005198647 /DNA_START=1208 /DNA_END=2122 /DNA_ORIENTATION=+